MRKENEQGLYGEGVKAALVHASVNWKDKEKNLAKLLALNEKAAGAGARIILNTELATTGYAFESRADIAPLTETIPGPTTGAFGQIAKKYGCYICIGLPEVDPETGKFYNAAALIGPAGRVLGRYRKVAPAFRENLWAARGNLPVLVTQTEFGRLGVVICAAGINNEGLCQTTIHGLILTRPVAGHDVNPVFCRPGPPCISGQ